MTKIAIESNCEIIKRGLQKILKDYEVLDYYEGIDEDFDLLVFEDEDLAKRGELKIRIVDEKELPINIYYSIISIKTSEKEILKAVEETLKGHNYIEKSLDEFKEYRNKKIKNIESLTRREKYLLEEILKGKTNKDISKEIYISDKTIKNNLTGLYKKLKVSGRREILKKYNEI
ncbi:MAG: LuxR C-terminal-related transcriptional regulator [Peptoniphilus sp.]|uniref:LuxR C-terminal-related transcriptional regulator n=1 Tax=Peptoniphilus sp. TaxID=1971214 RepID=UPI0025E13F67|nr:LuxR C-terminal-related transcriptional regulator [Peptoniphilus sp.]MCI5643400.1 LuxR C-terminal-related transcriptional regulator [Peptoniphilus sp.]MDD7352933.1 LuxR C-terminal-related transcriptional regulator [Peptoniphilaceae bacterium]